MGMVFGKIKVATPKYEVIKSIPDYEVRKYFPSVIAQVTYDPSDMKGDKDAGFSLLASYIGAFSKPNNAAKQPIAMTSPVITQNSKKIDMTAPVVTKNEGTLVTMQFILPEEYKAVEETPKPLDERVVVKEEGERKYGVVTFSGVASDEVVEGKVEKLRKCLEKDGFKVVGDFVLARFNPPWITLPMFRTNEVMIPVH